MWGALFVTLFIFLFSAGVAYIMLHGSDLWKTARIMTLKPGDKLYYSDKDENPFLINSRGLAEIIEVRKSSTGKYWVSFNYTGRYGGTKVEQLVFDDFYDFFISHDRKWYGA